MNCLSENTIRAFLGDDLDDTNRAQVVDHIETCEICQLAIEKVLDQQTVVEQTSRFSKDSSLTGSRLSKLHATIQDREKFFVNPQPFATTIPVIPGYKIVKEVGRGSSGVVFEAVQEELERRVAIKLLSGQLFGHQELKQRFLREAKSVATLNHPNIAQLFQISESEETGPYLVFEFVDATPLNEIITETGSLRINRTVEISRNVASAADHAHKQHLVHRDLKPSNILIENKSKNVKVIDFGLAVDPDQQSRLTLDSFIAGTPSYMSPEQIESPRDIDHRSDIYSLGVVMYEMLTGDVPFRGLSKKTLFRVIEEDPQRPRTINPDVPQDIETICLKSLSKNPAQRYQSMQELDDDLKRWQEGRPILAKPISRLTSTYRWMQRNPIISSLAISVATLLILITFGSVIGAVKLSNANSKAQLAKERSDLAAGKAIKQRDQLLRTFDSLVYDINDEINVEYIDQDEFQIRLLQIALDGLSETDMKDNVDVQVRMGDINLRLASVYARNDKFVDAQSALLEASQISDRLMRQTDQAMDAVRLRSLANWEAVNLASLAQNFDQAEKAVRVARNFERDSMNIQMSTPNQLNNDLNKGYAILELALAYQENGRTTDHVLGLLQEAFEIGEMLIDISENENPVATELDNFGFQGLGLVNFAAGGLAARYFAQGETQLAAEFDAKSKRSRDRMVLYEDGDKSFGTLKTENSQIEQAVDLDELTSLPRSQMLYEIAVREYRYSKQPFTLFLLAQNQYRLGCSFVETKDYEAASAEFDDCLKTIRSIKIDDQTSKLEILRLHADTLIHAIDTAVVLRTGPAEEQISELDLTIEKFAELVAVDQTYLRSLNRLKFERTKFQNEKSNKGGLQ